MSEPRWPAIDYCDDCGVSLDLHPEDMERRTACGVAVRKAETIEAFGRVTSEPSLIDADDAVGSRPLRPLPYADHDEERPALD